MIPFEDLRSQFRACIEHGDRQGVCNVLSAVIGAMLHTQHPDNERRDAVNLLMFWSENFNCADLIIAACNAKEATLRKQLQDAEQHAQDLKKALGNREKWIEKLKLIVAIQEVQNDPSRQVNQQIEDTRREVGQIRARADALEQTLRARLESLKNL